MISDNKRSEIIALSEIGYSNVKIAKLLEIHEKSVRNVKKEYQTALKDKEENNVDLPVKFADVADVKQHFANQTANIMNLIAEELQNPDKIAKASLRDLGIVYGIAADKHFILNNINQTVDVKHSLTKSVRQSTTKQADIIDIKSA